MSGQVIVLAKAPVPGLVKTRLCPPCSPRQAAAVAAAALADTLATVSATAVTRRVLALAGDCPDRPGWVTVAQREGTLGDRLAGAFADTAGPGGPVVLVGMDTPQLTVADLRAALDPLLAPGGPGATLGPAADGGWWALGLRDPRHAEVLADIPTSTARTGADTRAALERRGLTVLRLACLRDVDTAADAHAVAALCRPDSRFAVAVSRHVPTPDSAGPGRVAPQAAGAVGPVPLVPR
ncbi:hypothetical protein Aab01nite_62460 [Paractinoplanes abujensis]|uniref:Glycosyltransferase A (GT-A) superfamily protein (DUF2064 family) n=1 Tax=Paractinoplanes abujensis TaxID=882441 RepID=A0A7W7G1P3_9ACTN|nr:DUF2064 domain-containing protein [Actinoplanes abujensis]MBB4692844.1 glycosyltransferase A (GT-A) superfamily protein (DUF2064 family) [Actinoplanes abujensis]GID22656.1 hypothetical protein Aab01nite_62460 [Actinoplanes abujensis]